MARDVLVTNDLHLGTARVAGTTPKSAQALRMYLQDELRSLMHAHQDKHVVINGDLFDEYAVPVADILGFYQTASAWLDRTDDGSQKLVLGAGNHDLSKDSSRMSSFEFVAEILRQSYPDNVIVVLQPQMIFDGVYMIPHVANQDLFELALDQVPADAEVVLLHANYHNGFTVQSNHALNLSEDQAKKLIEVRESRTILFGHEHQARRDLGGRVVMAGNQLPSSIADCLRNPGNKKYAHVISSAGIEAIETWDGNESFQDIDWQDISLGIRDGVQFLRVSGQAKAEQASDVISVISKLRQQLDAFVVSNAVQIEGVQDIADLPSSLEMAKAQFDVLGFLYEQLTPRQAEVVRKLLANQEEKEQA
jgi:metallophosphoesterase superfamily enzyme